MGNFGREGANEWRWISLVVDSGACVTVMNPVELPNHEVRETPASKAGEAFTAASGDGIPNLGGMAVLAVTREYTRMLMQIIAAPVTKGLLSVKHLTKTGHYVIFDESSSYIVNKLCGEVNMLREENGNYMLDVWVPPNLESSFVGQP